MRAMFHALAIASTLVSLAAAPGPVDFSKALPTKVGEWTRPAKATVYDRRTLFDYIDGGAELYLAFDFVQAITFEYAAGPDDEIKLDIFDMGSARGAFGAFAHGRERVEAEVGQGSQFESGLLTFWKGRYYVSVLGFPESGPKSRATLELGKAVAAAIKETGSPPKIVDALPKDGLVPHSVRTFHHHNLQNDYGFVSDENVLGLGPKTDAVLAAYEQGMAPHVLLLVEYPATADAERAEKAALASVLGGKPAARKGEGWMGVRRVEKRLFMVINASSKEAANKVLAEVK